MSNRAQGMKIAHQSLVSKTYTSLTGTSRTIMIAGKLCPIFNSPKGYVAITGMNGHLSSSFLKLIK